MAMVTLHERAISTDRPVRRDFLCFVAATLSVVATMAMAGLQSASSAEADVLKAEDALFNADVNHDAAVIERGFAKEAVFVHANGQIQTKADYLQSIAKANFRLIEGQDRVVRVFGDVGVVRGTKSLVLANGMHLSGSYLTVYVKRDGRWQMLDQQSAPSPQAPEPARAN